MSHEALGRRFDSPTCASFLSPKRRPAASAPVSRAVSPRPGTPPAHLGPRRRAASPRPGTPPPAHLSPSRQSLTGLPPSPSRRLGQPRSPSRLSCTLTKIASRDSLNETEAEVEAAFSDRADYNSSSANSDTDYGFLTYTSERFPEVSVTRSVTTSREPIFNLPRVKAQLSVLFNRPLPPRRASTTTLQYTSVDEKKRQEGFLPKERASAMGSTASMGPTSTVYFTPLSEHVKHPFFLDVTSQGTQVSRTQLVSPSRVSMVSACIQTTVEEMQPSTSKAVTPTYVPHVADTPREEYVVSAVRTSASGLLEVKRESVVSATDEVLTVMMLPSPPHSPSAVPPPSPFANKEDKDKRKKNRLSFFSRISQRRTDKPPRCKYCQHSEPEIEQSRMVNTSILSNLTFDVCECQKMCPQMSKFLHFYEDYILRQHKAGPYADKSDVHAIAERILADREHRLGQGLALRADSLQPRDACLKVRFTRSCSLNENYLSHFVSYAGFKGFAVSGSEAFVVYAKAESAMTAKSCLNGMMVYLEHFLEVEETTPAYVLQHLSRVRVREPIEPCRMELVATHSRIANVVETSLMEVKEAERVRFAELPETSKGSKQDKKKRGGERRRGDDRYLPASRHLARGPAQAMHYCCASSAPLETDL